MTLLEVRCLGPLTVRVDGVSAPTGGPKQRVVLSMLLLRANASVSIDELTEAVWAGATPKNPRAVLQVYIANLRRLLSGNRSGSASERIETTPGGYRIIVRTDEFDYLLFGRQIGEATATLTIGDLPEAARRLRSALDLWRGVAFADLSAIAAATPELAALTERRLTAIEDLLELRLAMEPGHAVVPEAARLVEEHPFSERLRVVLVTALYRAQRQGDALAACRRTRRFLADELGVEPGPAFQEAERAILHQDPDFGRTRPDRAPATASSLPAAPSSFVGRAEDLAELTALLTGGRVRSITLTGTGGVGKTRLALAAAAAVEPSFPNGAAWVPLDTVTAAGRVTGAIAEALGVRAAPQRDLEDLVREYLRPRRMLLVLDNFEHVADAWQVVVDLLQTAARLTVLVTSRTPMQIAGEQRFEVLPLDLPDRDAPLATALDCASVQLFLARARLADRRFHIDEESCGAVIDVCRRLDGLPLAIELAAALVSVLEPGGLSWALRDVLGTLVGGPRDAAPRHRSLRDTIEWSYHLLTPPEQVVFDSMAAFAAAPDIDAVRAVSDGSPDVPDAMATLVRHGLVQASARDLGGRFSMLQTVKAFATEALVKGGGERATRRRHAEHYLRLAQDLRARLHDAGQVAAFRRLHLERAELDAALDWAAGHDGDLELALRLVGARWEYWAITGDVAVPRRWAEDTLNRLWTGDPGIRAEAASAAGTLCWLLGDLDSAVRYHGEALELFRDSGNPSGVAWSTMCLAVQEANAGRFDAAEVTARAALELARTAGAPHVLAGCHVTLGVLAIYRGDDRAAQAHQLDALAISEDSGDHRAAAMALINLSDIAEGRGEWLQAAGFVRRALRNSRRVGDQVQALFGIEAMGELRLRLGAPVAAARLLGAAHRHRTSMAQPLDAHERAALDDILDEIRSAAGLVAFAVAWADGLELTLDAAIDEAMAWSTGDGSALPSGDALAQRAALDRVL